jgi:uncharacterized protein
MQFYLDTNIVIYAVEGQQPFQQRARDHIAALENAGHRFVVSDLSWTECQVWPLRAGDGLLLLEYQRFFLAPHLNTECLTAAVAQRAALIRAIHRYGIADSLHLATAVASRCDRFLTNDQRLAGFPDIVVEVLP